MSGSSLVYVVATASDLPFKRVPLSLRLELFSLFPSYRWLCRCLVSPSLFDSPGALEMSDCDEAVGRANMIQTSTNTAFIGWRLSSRDTTA
jgi:hypothetical protein